MHDLDLNLDLTQRGYDCPVPITYGASLLSYFTVHYLAVIEIKHEDAKVSYPQNISQLQISIHGYARSVYISSSSSLRDKTEYSSDDCLSK